MISPSGSRIITKGHDRYIVFKNYYWQLVFRHNIPTAPYFANKEDALTISYDEDRYSILSKMKSLKRVGFNYEFLLYYPGTEGYNYWMQTNSPIDEQEENLPSGKSVDGYVPIEISWNYNYWGGLARSSNANFLIDGSTYHSNVCYGIGAIMSTIRCDLDASNSYNDVTLWLRVNPLDRISCLKKESTLLLFDTLSSLTIS